MKNIATSPILKTMFITFLFTSHSLFSANFNVSSYYKKIKASAYQVKEKITTSSIKAKKYIKKNPKKSLGMLLTLGIVTYYTLNKIFNKNSAHTDPSAMFAEFILLSQNKIPVTIISSCPENDFSSIKRHPEFNNLSDQAKSTFNNFLSSIYN